VDVVFNHMTAEYLNATGVGGTTADTYNKQYPGVPYGPEHFNPTCEITNWQDPVNVSDTELWGFILSRMRKINAPLMHFRHHQENCMNSSIQARQYHAPESRHFDSLLRNDCSEYNKHTFGGYIYDPPHSSHPGNIHSDDYDMVGSFL